MIYGNGEEQEGNNEKTIDVEDLKGKGEEVERNEEEEKPHHSTYPNTQTTARTINAQEEKESLPTCKIIF